MGAARMLHQWAHRVRHLVPDWHGHQSKSLAAMAWSLCLAGDCRTTWMALCRPTPAKGSSTRRRFERFLSNPRLDITTGAISLGKAMLADFGGRGRGPGSQLTLLLDETTLGPWLLCMKVSLAYHGRALPLAWLCYRQGQLPIPQPQIVELVLRQAALCLPRRASVVLMADRGLSWPLIIDLCGELGWNYLLRVQEQTGVQLSGGRSGRMGALASGQGQTFMGPGEVFRAAGWRRTNIVATWKKGERERWLLITDLPPRLGRCNDYRRRMWQEESFRDEKSHGFNWQRSRVRDPDHANRLLLVMMLATWMVMATGSLLIKRGWRHLVETTSHASLSIFQLGYRWWKRLARDNLPFNPTLRLNP